MQLPVAEETQWSGQIVIYDDFLDSSPDFHMLTEELSAILPGDPFLWFLLSKPSLPIAMQNTLVWMKPVSALQSSCYCAL